MRERRCASLLAVCGAALCVIAEADAREPRVRAPAQPLADALSDVARQTDTDVLFTPEAVSGRQAPALDGRMSAEEAITRLLRGSSLEVVRDADGALIVRPRAQAAATSQEHLAPTRLSEVIVTATKREAALGATPMSISTLDSMQLEAGPLVSARNIPRYAPGLVMTETNTGQRRITIRGIQSSGETTVGFYIDETPITGPNTATADPSAMTPDLNLYDVARVEVLRGPQGTLYGAGSLSGTLRILTNAADPDNFSGAVDTGVYAIEGGGTGSSLHGYVNAPVIEGVLGVRVAAFAENSAGYVDNVRLGVDDVNVVETRGARANATLDLPHNASLSLLAMHQRQDVEDTDYWYPSIGEHKTNNRIRLPFSNEISLANLTLSIDGPLATFTGVASYYTWDATRFIDSTRPAEAVIAPATHCPLYFDQSGPCNAAQADSYRAFVIATLPVVGVQPMGVEANTQELRLASPDGGDFDWTLGVFREHRDDQSESATLRADPLTGVVLEPAQYAFLRRTALAITQHATFGEATYRPDERWTFTFGARAYRYDKRTDAQVVQSGYLLGVRAGPAQSATSQDEGWVTRANVSVRPVEDTLVYAQFAEGFRPGGANTAPGLPPQFQTFTSDTVRSHEIGVRSTLGTDWLDLHLSLYRIDWRAMQMMVQIPNFRYVANLGASRIEGAEAEIEARLDQFTLRMALSARDGRLTEAISGVAQPGDRIPFEPDFTAFVGARYNWTVGADLDGALTLDYSYVGDAASEFSESSQYYERMGDYGSIDAEFSLETQRWRFAFWASNILNTRGRAHVESSLNAEQFTLAIRPRAVGASLARTF